jgi:hypothetical protein
MKYLLFPTLSVMLSTLGTGYGCQIAGMPAPDIETAVLVAGIVASATAVGAMTLASRRRRAPARAGVALR